MTEPVDPELDEHGFETHPSFGMASVHRVQSIGTTLFDSELRHREFVVLRIERAGRKRELSKDWIHGQEQVVEVEFSMAQWGAFVSSFNTSGVPCTITWDENGRVPGAPHEPRLKQSLKEVEAAAKKYTGRIKDAATAVREAFDRKASRKEMEELLHDLEAHISNAEPNIRYVSEKMSEHVENTVTKARADIEAMVANAAEQRGLDPASAPQALELMEGET